MAKSQNKNNNHKEKKTKSTFDRRATRVANDKVQLKMWKTLLLKMENSFKLAVAGCCPS